MGCIWSTGLKKAGGGFTFSNTLGKGYGAGFAVHDRKIAKAYYDSTELRPTLGKAGASMVSLPTCSACQTLGGSTVRNVATLSALLFHLFAKLRGRHVVGV